LLIGDLILPTSDLPTSDPDLLIAQFESASDFDIRISDFANGFLIAD
jgi:hypothetical protein